MKHIPPVRNKELPLPPLWDHHGHFSALGSLSEELDLRGALSPEDLLDKLKKHAEKKEPGEWITGFGWDQNLWGKKSPSLVEMDKAAGGHPLFVRRIDCHAAIANTVSLRLAGLCEDSHIDGGEFVKKAGKWTGVVVDNAMAPFFSAMPAPSKRVIRRRMVKAFSVLRSFGLSGATDMQLKEDEISVLSDMDATGKLDFPVLGYKEWTPGHSIPRKLIRGDRFALAGMKIFLDGALGSRGAALSEQYSDDGKNRGLLLVSRTEILELLEEAGARKMPLAFHAIGDRALEEFLSALERLKRPAPRIRIEHLQVTPAPLLKRLATANVTVSLQPCHYLSDKDWAPQRLGRGRIGHSYLLRSIVDGKKYLFGTDFPIEPPDPVRTLAASLSRPEKERLTIREVLKGMACPSYFRKFGRAARIHGFDGSRMEDPVESLKWRISADE